MVCSACCAVGAGSLVLDELGQPSDLSVDGLETVLVQLARVAVEPLPRPRQRAAHAVALLFYAAAAPFQDLQPDVRAGLREEREPCPEAFFVKGIRPDVGEQLREVLLAVGGELVHPLATP
jgi:hypothetical protein